MSLKSVNSWKYVLMCSPRGRHKLDKVSREKFLKNKQSLRTQCTVCKRELELSENKNNPKTFFVTEV